MTNRSFTQDDVGKRVVDTTGDVIGFVESVRDGQPYIEPDTDVDDPILAKLGLGTDEEAKVPYPLEDDHVETVGDGEIRVRRV